MRPLCTGRFRAPEAWSLSIPQLPATEASPGPPPSRAGRVHGLEDVFQDLLLQFFGNTVVYLYKY